MDHLRIAARVVEARRKRPKVSKRPVEVPISVEPETMLKPPTEYSCRMEISLTADFEGNAAKGELIKKIKNEVINAIKIGVGHVATDMELQSTGVVVSPLRVECAVNDQASVEDESEFEESEPPPELDPEPEPKPKKRRRR